MYTKKAMRKRRFFGSENNMGAYTQIPTENPCD